MPEQWKDMPGYRGIYMVSDAARVLSLCWNKERLLSPYHTPNGYRVTLYQPDTKHRACHWLNRMVKLAFDPIRYPADYLVIYMDDDCFNPKLSNLKWVKNVGEGAHHTRLKEDQVREIKQLYMSDPTLTQITLATRYGVARETISKIVNGVTWGHIS
jgi:hypothetical protein